MINTLILWFWCCEHVRGKYQKYWNSWGKVSEFLEREKVRTLKIAIQIITAPLLLVEKKKYVRRMEIMFSIFTKWISLSLQVLSKKILDAKT